MAEEPVDADFDNAAVYRITLPADATLFAPPQVGKGWEGVLLEIAYRGDVARLYADGRLIADNFYNGRPFLFGLWRLTPGTKELELRILPLQKDMPVYFPREADVRTAGEEVRYVTIQPRP